jgi:hypothetical protein
MATKLLVFHKAVQTAKAKEDAAWEVANAAHMSMMEAMDIAIMADAEAEWVAERYPRSLEAARKAKSAEWWAAKATLAEAVWLATLKAATVAKTLTAKAERTEAKALAAEARAEAKAWAAEARAAAVKARFAAAEEAEPAAVRTAKEEWMYANMWAERAAMEAVQAAACCQLSVR